MSHSTTALRWAIFLAGSALGSVSLAAAWENGSTLGSTSLSQAMYGVGFVALVVATWAIPPAVEIRWRQKAFVSAVIAGAVCFCLTVIVVLNTIGHVSNNRATGVAERAAIASEYERAKMTVETVNIELNAARASKLFARTAACGNDTEEASKVFCDTYRALKKRLEEAEKILSGSKPKPADAQAETIGWVIGSSPALVAKASPVVLGAGVEIAAIIMFWLWSSLGGKMPAPPLHGETVIEKRQEDRGALETVKAISASPETVPAVLRIAGPSGEDAKPRRLNKPAFRVRINLDGSYHKGDLARMKRAAQN